MQETDRVDLVKLMMNAVEMPDKEISDAELITELTHDHDEEDMSTIATATTKTKKGKCLSQQVCVKT